jgi:hypothetical protein
MLNYLKNDGQITQLDHIDKNLIIYIAKKSVLFISTVMEHLAAESYQRPSTMKFLLSKDVTNGSPNS